MKRFSLICAFVCFSIQLQAQIAKDPCKFDYQAKVTACAPEIDNHDKFATVTWDFSHVDLAGKQVRIEILPVKDCFNGEKATRFRDVFNIEIKQENIKGSAEVLSRDLWAKCFKWRAVITSPDCEVVSDWNYHTII